MPGSAEPGSSMTSTVGRTSRHASAQGARKTVAKTSTTSCGMSPLLSERVAQNGPCKKKLRELCVSLQRLIQKGIEVTVCVSVRLLASCFARSPPKTKTKTKNGHIDLYPSIQASEAREEARATLRLRRHLLDRAGRHVHKEPMGK